MKKTYEPRKGGSRVVEPKGKTKADEPKKKEA